MAYDFSKLDSELNEAKEWLSREYRGLRTGRATPMILDSVQVSAYGSYQPLKHVASISTEDARTLRVQPFDAGLMKDIERAISTADLGLGTAPDQTGIRITFPNLTAERRQELTKIAKGKLEEARSSVRVARDECWKTIQEKEKTSEITEDDKFSFKDEMQKRIDKANEELEMAFEKKETEMTN